MWEDLQLRGCQVALHQPQVLQQIASIRVALRWIFCDGLADHGFELLRHFGIEDSHRRRRFMTDAVDRTYEGVGEKRMVTCEGLVEHDAERENVGTAIGTLLQQNLRCHVGWCAGQAAGTVDSGALIGARQVLADAKIQNLHLAGVGQHDVFRFDIAMDNSALVGRDERLRTLDGDVQKFVQCHARSQPISQRLAFHIFHYQEYLAPVFKNVINRRDVGIAETGNALGFFLEPATIKRISAKMRSHAFQRDNALKFAVLSAIDLAHASLAQPRPDHEATGYGPREEFARLSRC